MAIHKRVHVCAQDTLFKSLGKTRELLWNITGRCCVVTTGEPTTKRYFTVGYEIRRVVSDYFVYIKHFWNVVVYFLMK